VIRNDEKRSSATTKVPRIAGSKIVLKSGAVVLSDSTVVQEIGIPGIPALWDMSVIYLVEGPDYRDRTFVPYPKAEAPDSDGLWRYRLQVTADQDSIIARARRFVLSQNRKDIPVTLTAMGIQFRIIDGAWFPLFSEDEILRLAQPGTLSNVVNGYGLFGSMGLYREEWEITPEEAANLGYPIQVTDEPII